MRAIASFAPPTETACKVAVRRARKRWTALVHSAERRTDAGDRISRDRKARTTSAIGPSVVW
ncbi:hypothetical protein WG70_12445 [Burkholderia oklahomensis EO147]|nr:hypothetical protein WG70_12445 [Burkholderia oklahomensis EO147]AOI49972.1 hypothetical protein WI23_30215 [Burkholderia oklahomensis C6786]KUY53110.1 hypothetical protein WI23_23235 [Burkholderia oklahomensis C6786]KUY65124.1 hypothetical protein WG70_28335 [Burkholderia oklahomensis EO147]